MVDFLETVLGIVLTIVFNLVPLALIVVVVVYLSRRSQRGAGPQIPTLELMDQADSAVGTRFREVAPGEDFLLAIPARTTGPGSGTVGWLIASTRRIWWMSAPGRSNAQEAEYGYDLLANVVGGSAFKLPVLSIGSVQFRASRDSAEAMSQVIRRQRDVVGVQPVVAASESTHTAKLGVADELAKFAAMRDSGVLTDEEFQRKKRELIG